MAEAREFITRRYDEGVPFFTKAALENIVQQFDNCAGMPAHEQRIIRVPALNGEIIEFPLETGNVYPYDYGDDDHICIM